MTEVQLLPAEAKYIKKIKDKKGKGLQQNAVGGIRKEYTVGEEKCGDLSGIYGYDIYYNNFDITFDFFYNIL